MPDLNYHLSLSQAQPIKLIFAYGKTDEISYHGSRRGTKEVNLLNYMPKSIPTNSSYLSATVDNVRITDNNSQIRNIVLFVVYLPLYLLFTDHSPFQHYLLSLQSYAVPKVKYKTSYLPGKHYFFMFLSSLFFHLCLIG